MKSHLVFSLHDPEATIVKKLSVFTPFLKKNFESAFVSITPPTEKAQKNLITEMLDNHFYKLNYNRKGSLTGDHHVSCYKNAIRNTNSEDVLHLCTPDRLSFALANHESAFLKDLKRAETQKLPTLFMRSKKAWSTHPKNYKAIELMLTTLALELYNMELEFAWCHLTLRSNKLKKILPNIKQNDISMYTEVAVNLKNDLRTQKVDWLEWEDPFIFDTNPKKFKKERESDENEDQKRLSYVLSSINIILTDWHKNLG